MRQIIRQRELVSDDVYYPGEPGENGTRPVLTLPQFIAAVTSGDANINAVMLEPADDVQTLVTYLSHLNLIVVHFPNVGEGRGYSQAYLLRQRLHYQGELRARGALKRDQLYFLARCGFDSFELDPTENLTAALAAFMTFSVAYQEGSSEILALKRRESTASPPV